MLPVCECREWSVQHFKMRLRVCVITVLFTAVFALDKNAPCVTPNGENARCLPIHDCTVIEKAIAYLDSVAVDFAQKSQCGHDGTAPFVCCGSTGRPAVSSSPAASTTKEPAYVESSSQIYPDFVDHALLPDATLCGLQLTQERHSHEKVTQADEFPWMAALKYVRNNSTKTSRSVFIQCVGTLISDRYVLTLAQCLDIPDFRLTGVRLGEWNFTSPEDCVKIGPERFCSRPADLRIEKQIRHAYYNKVTGSNNIALLRLNKRVQLTDFIRALCLPPSDHPAPEVGTIMEASGWEINSPSFTSNIKVKRKKFMADGSTCAKVFSNHTNVNVQEACFTNQGKTEGCGDPGSPLMRVYQKTDYTDEEQFYLEGIALGPNCIKNQPCLYVRVSKYIKWITNNLDY